MSEKVKAEIQSFMNGLAAQYADDTSRPPDSITATDLAKRLSEQQGRPVGRNVAKRLLDEAVAAGKAQKKAVLVDGKRATVYWPAKP